MNDDDIHDLIRQTHPKPEFHPGFHREIWGRIAVAEEQSWTARWRQWSEPLLRWIVQPAPAMATVAAMLLLGAGFGLLVTPDSAGDAAALRTAYIASINPVAAARITPRP